MRHLFKTWCSHARLLIPGTASEKSGQGVDTAISLSCALAILVHHKIYVRTGMGPT